MAPDTLPALPGNGVHYLVTVTWRGRMHVDPLRVFAREGDARAYARWLEDANGPDAPVLYECRGDRPPRRLKL